MYFSLYNINQAALNSVWEKEQEAVCKKKVWCVLFVWVNILIVYVELTVYVCLEVEKKWYCTYIWGEETGSVLHKM